MTAEHDALRDTIAAVAVGAADPSETARVERHAAECAVCREELASLRAAAGVLGVAVPQHEPSAGLRRSLMATVRAEAAERAGGEAGEARAAAATRPRRNPLDLLRRWPAVAAVAAVAGLMTGWGIASQTGGEGPGDVTARSVAGTADAPGMTGRLVYVRGEDTAVIRLSGPPALEPGEAYQLWVLRDGLPPRSAGLLEEVGPAGARGVATGLAEGDGLAVTAQPRDARDAPEGPILLEASLGGS